MNVFIEIMKRLYSNNSSKKSNDEKYLCTFLAHLFKAGAV